MKRSSSLNHGRVAAVRSLVLLMLATGSAWAQEDRGFKLKADYTAQTDSNLFRLPANANTQTLLGKSSGSEQIGVSTLGLSFNTSQSLQNIELDVSLVDYRYQNFNYLDFTATNYVANWRYAITPRLRGTLSGTRKETLNSFADFTGFGQRNQRTDTTTRLDADYQIDGPWHIVAGLATTRQANQLQLVAGSDFATNSADIGLRHQFSSGSSIAYTVRQNDGSYLNRVLSAASFNDDGFKQIDNDLRLRWVISGKSTADFNLTNQNRTHPHFATRDYSGFASGASFNWSISGKTALNLAYAHELSAFQTANTNYAQTDRITLAPSWQISTKTLLRASLGWSTIEYLGTPSAVVASQRRDTTRDTNLTFLWQPVQQITLTTALQNQSRASTQAGLDFDSTQVTLSAQYLY